MDEQSLFISEIESYCRNAGIAESTFGRRAVNDGKFVRRLREGKGVTTSTVSKVRKFIGVRRNKQNSFDRNVQENIKEISKSRKDRLNNEADAEYRKREDLKYFTAMYPHKAGYRAIKAINKYVIREKTSSQCNFIYSLVD